jgi:hypothetical protein
MLRNCAAILFVCFDMTADVTHLVYLADALDYEMLADREGNHGTQSRLR